jgi:type III pantothenate kinase
MIWAILIGNTRVVAALMMGEKIIWRSIMPTASLRRASKASSWARSLRKKSNVEGLIVASVVPPVDGLVRETLKKNFKRTPLFVTAKTSGIKVRLKKPSEVGADRLANAVAAMECFGAPAIVVDYGTGTTFDVIDKGGSYRGGAILPGLGISLRALHEYTAKIPLVKFERTHYAVGRSTQDAVRSGIYHGAIGTTKELLLRIRRELGTAAPSVATGGYCGVFRNTGLFRYIEPDLTLKGIALIWKRKHA